METEIRQAIYDHTISASSLSASNTFWVKAKQEQTGTYCVLSLISNPLNKDSQKQYEEIFFQISLFGKSLSSLESIESEILDLWDFSSTTLKNRFTNFSVVGVGRIARGSLRVEDDYWHNYIQYKLELQAD